MQSQQRNLILNISEVDKYLLTQGTANCHCLPGQVDLEMIELLHPIIVRAPLSICILVRTYENWLDIYFFHKAFQSYTAGICRDI